MQAAESPSPGAGLAAFHPAHQPQGGCGAYVACRLLSSPVHAAESLGDCTSIALLDFTDTVTTTTPTARLRRAYVAINTQAPFMHGAHGLFHARPLRRGVTSGDNARVQRDRKST